MARRISTTAPISPEGSTKASPKVIFGQNISNSDFYYQRFLDEASRLFKEGNDEVETLLFSSDRTGTF